MEFSQTEEWMFKNLIARLINHHTNFQIFNIQIPENIFSQMLKAWIAEDFFPFSEAFGIFEISERFQ